METWTKLNKYVNIRRRKQTYPCSKFALFENIELRIE